MSLTDDESKLIDGIIAQHDRDRMAGEGWTDTTVKAALRSVLRLRSAPSPLDEGMLVVEPRGRDDLRRISKVLNTPNQLSPESVKVLDKVVADAYASLSTQEPAAGESDANGMLVPEFSCDDDGSLTVEWYRSNTSVLSVSSDDSAEFHFAAATGPGITSSGCWQLGQDPPQSFYDAYRAVVAPVDPAPLLAAQKDGQTQLEALKAAVKAAGPALEAGAGELEQISRECLNDEWKQHQSYAEQLRALLGVVGG